MNSSYSYNMNNMNSMNMLNSMTNLNGAPKPQDKKGKQQVIKSQLQSLNLYAKAEEMKFLGNQITALKYSIVEYCQEYKIDQQAKYAIIRILDEAIDICHNTDRDMGLSITTTILTGGLTSFWVAMAMQKKSAMMKKLQDQLPLLLEQIFQKEELEQEIQSHKNLIDLLKAQGSKFPPQQQQENFDRWVDVLKKAGVVDQNLTIGDSDTVSGQQLLEFLDIFEAQGRLFREGSQVYCRMGDGPLCEKKYLHLYRSKNSGAPAHIYFDVKPYQGNIFQDFSSTPVIN